MAHIVKRRGHKEKFDERKVYASVYNACAMTEAMPHTKCEKIADGVTKKVKAWMGDRKNVTAQQIFDFTTKTLKKYNADAAFMYETHRDIS